MLCVLIRLRLLSRHIPGRQVEIGESSVEAAKTLHRLGPKDRADGNISFSANQLFHRHWSLRLSAGDNDGVEGQAEVELLDT